jgi:hypothetical protein
VIPISPITGRKPLFYRIGSISQFKESLYRIFKQTGPEHEGQRKRRKKKTAAEGVKP